MAAALSAPDTAEWQAFTRRYLAADGRVIDTANHGISHSEGQGYGMLFAAWFGDRPRFELIWRWTQGHLSRSGDALHAWRFDPSGGPGLRDSNNATDGDIFIAWALWNAAERWDEPRWRAAAGRIAAAILEHCTRRVDGRLLLLPGARGFTDGAATTVNLSYYAFAGLRALSHAHPDPRWAVLERDGLALMHEASFGRWGLPPDWLLVPAGGGPPVPAPRWPARFSWDAVRVPLNLAWLGAEAPPRAAAQRFWADGRHAHRPPAWVDLRSGVIAPYAGHAGIRAIAALVEGQRGAPARVADAPDYYGSALVLQARLAPHLTPLPARTVAEPAPPPPPGLLASALDSMRGWMSSGQAEEPETAAPQWSRPEFLAPSAVRGVAPGLRGLGPPR